MANDYCSVQQIKDGLPDVSLGATYDAFLATLATRVSRLIDGYHRREPGAYYASADSTRYFNGSGTTSLWIGELAAAPTTVQVAESGVLATLTSWASTDYLCWPYNALLDGMPYLRLDIELISGTQSVWPGYIKAVKIAGRFGFSTSVPEEIAEAAIIQAVRWFKRGQQAYQDTSAILELGQLRYLQKLDPDVEQILSAPKFTKVTI